MSVYAFLKNGNIENIVEVDKDAVQALPLLFPEIEEFVEATDETGLPSVDGTFVNGKFRSPSPYISWVWSDKDRRWDAPVSVPDTEKSWVWNEENLLWVEIAEQSPYPDA